MTRDRFRPGFRLRVLGSFALLLTGAIAVGVVLQRAALLRSLDREVATSLDQERAELGALAAGTDPTTGEPFGDDARSIIRTFLATNLPEEGEVFLAFVDGRPYRTTIAPYRLDQDAVLAARWASLEVGERGHLDTPAGPVQYLAVPLQENGATKAVFVVANFVAAERAEIDRAVRTEAAVSVVVLALATIVAWFVAGRLLRPVRALTTAAESIGESDLTRRIPVEGHDEVARLARTFNEMLDRLEAAFRTQRAFVDDAGHELRTPITVVRGHLELMGDDPEERREALAVVDDELDRMSRIVEDLLLLAKAEQPDFVRPGTVELADLTTELFVKCRTLGDRAWVLDACADGPARLDAQRVTQAVLNLARNAVEHTAPGTEIGVGSTVVDGTVRIHVRDRGPGIAEADQQRIFERFARSDERRRSDGAGLGLAIVRTVAEAHGGSVTLDSRPGNGARFTLVLPLDDEPDRHPTQEDPWRAS